MPTLVPIPIDDYQVGRLPDLDGARVLVDVEVLRTVNVYASIASHMPMPSAGLKAGWPGIRRVTASLCRQAVSRSQTVSLAAAYDLVLRVYSERENHSSAFTNHLGLRL